MNYKINKHPLIGYTYRLLAKKIIPKQRCIHNIGVGKKPVIR